MTHDLAILIPLFRHNELRLEHLKTTLQYLRKLEGNPFIVLGSLNLEGFFSFSSEILNKVDCVHFMRGGEGIFQKEAILNSAFSRVPNEIKKILFLDLDNFSLDKNWLKKISLTLEDHDFVQACDFYYYLSREMTKKVCRGAVTFESVKEDALPYGVGQDFISERTIFVPGYRYRSMHLAGKESDRFFCGPMGGAIAIRREMFEEMGGFSLGCGVASLPFPIFKNRHAPYSSSYLQPLVVYPSRALNETKAEKSYNWRMGYVDSPVIHLWHKRTIEGIYADAYLEVFKSSVNLEEDFVLNDTGGLEFSAKGRRLDSLFKSLLNEYLPASWEEMNLTAKSYPLRLKRFCIPRVQELVTIHSLDRESSLKLEARLFGRMCAYADFLKVSSLNQPATFELQKAFIYCDLKWTGAHFKLAEELKRLAVKWAWKEGRPIKGFENYLS